MRGTLAWLEERGFDPGKVVLHGWSIGGVTVLRSALGTGVAAVVEDAGYADLPLLPRGALHVRTSVAAATDIKSSFLPFRKGSGEPVFREPSSWRTLPTSARATRSQATLVGSSL